VTKSMLASKNLPKPILKTSQGHHWIRVLAAELALRLKEARESIPALWPKSIVLHVRQGYETSRSKQAPFPFNREVTVDLIASAGDKLWKELVGTENSRSTPMKITNVQLSFSGIDSMEAGQQNIEGFFKPPSQSSDNREAKPPPRNLKRKRDALHNDSPLLGGEAEITVGESRSTPLSPTPDEASSSSSFVCERCGKKITVPDALDGLSDDIKMEALTAIKLEHNDFHFAQDLAKEGVPEGRPKRIIRPLGKPPPAKKKKKAIVSGETEQEKEGIKRFFAKG